MSESPAETSTFLPNCAVEEKEPVTNPSPVSVTLTPGRKSDPGPPKLPARTQGGACAFSRRPIRRKSTSVHFKLLPKVRQIAQSLIVLASTDQESSIHVVHGHDPLQLTAIESEVSLEFRAAAETHEPQHRSP